MLALCGLVTSLLSGMLNREAFFLLLLCSANIFAKSFNDLIKTI